MLLGLHYTLSIGHILHVIRLWLRSSTLLISAAQWLVDFVAKKQLINLKRASAILRLCPTDKFPLSKKSSRTRIVQSRCMTMACKFFENKSSLKSALQVWEEVREPHYEQIWFHSLLIRAGVFTGGTIHLGPPFHVLIPMCMANACFSFQYQTLKERGDVFDRSMPSAI